MLSYGIANFRRLKNIPSIPIKPITILVGKNSSGKSSYLRSLPLLNQSVSTETSGAILWWGDLVDFGSFKETFHYKSTEKEILFRFKISEINIRDSLRYVSPYYRHNVLLNSANTVFRNIDVEIGISNYVRDKSNDSNISYVSSYKITIQSETIGVTFLFSPEGAITSALYGQIDILSDLQDKDATIAVNNLFPMFLFRDARMPYSAVGDDPKIDSSIQNVREIIKHFYSKKTGAAKLNELSLMFLNSAVFSTKRLKAIQGRALDDEVTSLFTRLEEKANDDQNAELMRYALIHCLPALSTAIAQKLAAIISNISYIGPARVRSERYYRQQDLSVSTISPDGNNFPIFLASLSKAQIDELSDVIHQLYGYRLKLKKESGHISIFLEDEGFSINLIDTGYGLSQILPVVGQMWWSGKDHRSRRPYAVRGAERIVAIEQPELHLHPAHQATLADSFVLFSRPEQKSKRSQLHFLVETHSEVLINRLGELIFEKKIDKDDVQIVIFEDDKREKYTTTATISSFNEDGSLANWPIGFFGTK